MPTVRHSDHAARPGRSSWVGIVLAVFLVTTQALALVHELEHPLTGTDHECPLCVGGHGLDQLAVPQAAEPAPAGTASVSFAPGALSERVIRVRSACARGPPAFLAS
jgi:hypothetical protein